MPETPDGRSRQLDPYLEEALRIGPFHTALQIAIANSGLTLERLEYRLGNRGFAIGRSTLSYWQQGRRRPERASSMAALAALEEILDVPPEALSSLLGPRRPRGRWIGYQGQGLSWDDVWAVNDDVKRLVAIDSRRHTNRIQDVSVSERIVVGADQRLHSWEYQTVLRAIQPSADRSLYIYNAEPDVDVDKIVISDMEGCRIGRRRTIVEDHFLAIEFLFDRTMAEGETHFVAFTADFSGAFIPDVEPVSAIEGLRAFRRVAPTYVLRARFESDQFPVRCYHMRSARMSSAEQVIDELPISPLGTTHVAVQNVQPGVHGIKWDWE